MLYHKIHCYVSVRIWFFKWNLFGQILKLKTVKHKLILCRKQCRLFILDGSSFGVAHQWTNLWRNWKSYYMSEKSWPILIVRLVKTSRTDSIAEFLSVWEKAECYEDVAIHSELWFKIIMFSLFFLHLWKNILKNLNFRIKAMIRWEWLATLIYRWHSFKFRYFIDLFIQTYLWCV